MSYRSDFPDIENLVEEARFAYHQIYFWHLGQGTRKFEERFKEHESADAWRTKYLALLSELVKPTEAAAEDMLYVAREVLSGRMEWSYSEKSDQGVTLSNWARRIQELLQERDKRLKDKQISDQLHSFTNMSSEGRSADGLRIEIPVGRSELWTVETYLRYAGIAYGDVPEKENIGGRVFLIQTNLELTRDSKRQYTFNNAKLLHVEPVAEEQTLANLIGKGELIVEAVVLGE